MVKVIIQEIRNEDSSTGWSHLVTGASEANLACKHTDLVGRAAGAMKIRWLIWIAVVPFKLQGLQHIR